ncbi:hypothetical protein ABFV80_001028 [Vandammella animalimorsus]|uniref:hypothetical protein n=1 Tax=Vandammella animalimorsus TaxID=2029117 RepID=UPI00325B8267
MKRAILFMSAALMACVAWTQPDGNEYATMDEGLARIGITPEKLKKEAVASQRLLAMKAHIENQNPDAYGGAWIGQDENGNPYPIIAIKQSLRKNLGLKNEEGIVFVEVKFSCKELQEAQQRITQALMPADYHQAAALSVGIMDELNRVKITIKPTHEKETLRRLGKLRLPGDIYTIVIVNGNIDG